MIRKYALGFMALALMSAAGEVSAAAGSVEAPEATAKKSIVPSKYSGKYKDGGDAVAQFIKEQSSGKEGFEFGAFFSFCRKNGLDETKVAHYESLVADKANNHGIEGRARMTLGNMLRAKARKNGKLVGLNDAEVEFNLPKPAVSGAAAAAQETAASTETETPATESEDVSADTASTDAEVTE